jgi:hypothetical protein
MNKNKKYKIGIDYNEDLDEYSEFVTLTIEDLSDFFYQVRGFPTILRLGDLMGEGQSGGRFVTEVAQKLEAEIIKDIGFEEYKKQMDKLMGND